MGQFSATDRVTATHPVGVWGNWYLLDPNATTVDVHYDNETLDSGSNAAVFGRLYYSASPTGSSPTQIGTQPATFGGTDMPKVHSYSVSGVPGGSYVAGFIGANTSGNTISIDITLFDDVDYCVYGTTIRGAQPKFVQLTAQVITALAQFSKNAWGYWILGIFVGDNLDIDLMCSQPRPTVPTFTWQDVLALKDPGADTLLFVVRNKAFQFLHHLAWPTYCTCVPGSPSPVEPIPRVLPQPPGVPDGPLTTYTCDNADLCTQLQELTTAVHSLAARQSVISYLVNLIQKQSVPFAYHTGTVHSGLSGRGEITVTGTLGLSVTFTTVDPSLGNNADYPPTVWTLGELSLGTAEGWQSRHPIRHAEQLLLDVSGAITRVGYNFPPGCVATITELLMNP